MINTIIEKQFNNELPAPGKTGVDWYLFCYFLNKFRNGKFLEIGVGKGGSLISLTTYSNDVTAIDDWAHGWSKDIVQTHLNYINKTVKFIDKDSLTINPTELETYDVIHLDANKQYNKVLQDLLLCDVISTGIVCVDDYMNSMWPEVTRAVDYFLMQNNQWRMIMIGNHQAFIAKKPIAVKELIRDWPVAMLDNTLYLTYGTLPDIVKPFVEHGAMIYSWHKIAWNN